MARSQLRVGGWNVCPDSNELSRHGTVVRVEPKVMDALMLLVERAGAVVTKEELLARVWPGVFVSSSTLFRLISELRSSLDDSASTPIYVETIPKRGYRLIATVERRDHVTVTRADSSRWSVLAGVGAAIVALCGAWWTVGPGTADSGIAESIMAPQAFEVGEVLEHRADCGSFDRARQSYADAIVEEPAFEPAYLNLIDTYLASAVLGCVNGADANVQIGTLIGHAIGSGDVTSTDISTGPSVDWRRRIASRRFWWPDGLGDGLAPFADIPRAPDVSRAAVMLVAGRPEEAVVEAERAYREESAAIGEMWTLAVVQLFGGRPRAALRSFDNLLALYPGFPPAVSMRVLALWEGGATADAIAASRTAAAAVRAPLDRFAPVPALVLRWAGESRAASRAIEQWSHAAAQSPWVAPTSQVVAALARGDLSDARQWLDRAQAVGDPWSRMANVDPTLRIR